MNESNKLELKLLTYPGSKGYAVKRFVNETEVSEDTFNDFVNFERLQVEKEILTTLVLMRR